MKKLDEAVIKLINEDVVGGKKLIQDELYDRLGMMLEEKLKDYAPTIFSEGLVGKQKKLDKNKNNKIDSEDFKMLRNESLESDDNSNDDQVLSEEYEFLVKELETLVEEIENETGDELTESEIEELADLLLEAMEVDPDEQDGDEEDFDDEDEEEIEEDFDEEE